MRKIQFNEDTIQQIREYVVDEKHTVKEACNRFNIKYDTLKRVMWENNIIPVKRGNRPSIEVTPEIESQVCSLFEDTKMSVADICKEAGIYDYMMQSILHKNFTQEYIDKRHALFYRNSKLVDKNPMKNMTGDNHPNFKGLIDDGDGYLICQKPEWFTGRKAKSYVYVHHIVYCLATGMTEIPKGFVIHHVDLNKRNNDISNLAMMTISAHGRLHSMLNRLSKVQRLSVQE